MISRDLLMDLLAMIIMRVIVEHHYRWQAEQQPYDREFATIVANYG